MRAEMHAHRNDVDVERLEHGVRKVRRGIGDDRDPAPRRVMRHILLARHGVRVLAGNLAEAGGEREEPRRLVRMDVQRPCARARDHQAEPSSEASSRASAVRWRPDDRASVQ